MESGESKIILGRFQSYIVNTKEELEAAEKQLFSTQFIKSVKISIYCIEEGKCHYYKSQCTGKDYILLDDGEWKYDGEN